MTAPRIETYPDFSPVLLCTACGELVSVVVIVEDRRGGASLCAECLAVASNAMEAHLNKAEEVGGVVETC